ncbi:hypothetical protein RF683_05555 [Flavobacterium sp. 20NA77.7]|uniref:Tissue inhibitor of metalloproteinase n=1 Tax=Flavobacterium nakdongensis TaxID=3073563 RepID=A0ABY9R7M3_9FLAO|nr:hypothetical protein [Flavobacterium sp. 20NA77.7]WMW76966.1 hypothetical protein RF683_05555 [Flavobacterium sp. 20NA77.7]
MPIKASKTTTKLKIFMRIIFKSILFVLTLFLFSFSNKYKIESEFEKFHKLELLALKNGKIGKEYTYDLTNKKGCNKTKIKYLGVIKTNNGKQYKVLSSFFVYSVASTCHGTSNIKIYNLNNKFLGNYNVGMPEDLPAEIKNNKYICWSKTKDCDLRNNFSINFEKGLPKRFFLPCSQKRGDEMILTN